MQVNKCGVNSRQERSLRPIYTGREKLYLIKLYKCISKSQIYKVSQKSTFIQLKTPYNDYLWVSRKMFKTCIASSRCKSLDTSDGTIGPLNASNNLNKKKNQKRS